MIKLPATKTKLKSATKSIWLFPLILTLILISLSLLEINGSSIGIYNQFFFGNREDPSLILNQPRAIRSDEWVVNTQMTIAQSNNAYEEINKNIGNGSDMSLIIDAPHSGFSQLFKPHNLSFFIMPFEKAFAFKWWVMGYFLVLSSYFFILALMPNKKLLAVILSLSLFFAPFVQWWYQFITLGPMYYTLFAGTLFIYITRAPNRRQKILLTAALIYTLTCLALVQYPPFQIPCILAMALFVIGYLLEIKSNGAKNIFKGTLSYALAACVVAGIFTGIFLYEKREIVNTVENTAYPGKRIVKSGGYDIRHLLTNNLSFQLQKNTNAAAYINQKSRATNQSESSNFILLIPFLLIPSIVLLFKSYRNGRRLDYPLLMVLVGFVGVIVWLLTPNLDWAGRAILLDKVPLQRLLIGIGLLNFMSILLFIRGYARHNKFSAQKSAIYAIIVWATLLALGWSVHLEFPAFIGYKSLLALSFPIPIIIYLLLQKYHILALAVFCGFSIISTAWINPLYRGTEILTENALSSAIRSVESSDDQRWVVEDSLLQSFALMNGKPSLTGIYAYPQLDIWKSSTKPDDTYIYNRYAHVNFVLDRNPNEEIETKLSSNTSDHFTVTTEVCSEFIQSKNIDFIVTSGPLTEQIAPCAELIREVQYPTSTFRIYRLVFSK